MSSTARWQGILFLSSLDPYVKLALYCDGTRVGRGATRVKRRVTNPVFSEKFNFDLTSNQIAYTTLVIKIMNNVESAPTCLGATIIGYESSGDGQEHWLCMMECLSQHVDAWHALYDWLGCKMEMVSIILKLRVGCYGYWLRIYREGMDP